MKLRKIHLVTILCVVMAFSCNDQDEPRANETDPSKELEAVSQITDSKGNIYIAGFDQASSINQNPVVEKRDSNGNTLWRTVYEDTGVDGKANLVTLDANDIPYISFSVDGGSNNDGYINKKEIETGAFSNVYMNSYGSGGGPQVSIITKLNPENGKITKGTFVTAQLTSGNTNSLNVTKIGFNNGNLVFEVSSAAWPPGIGSSYQRLSNIDDSDRVDGAFKVYYEMNNDLSEILVATLLTE